MIPIMQIYSLYLNYTHEKIKIILVVMEDIFRDFTRPRFHVGLYRLLILIIMEDALGGRENTRRLLEYGS